jgi:hypothetical protein
LSGTPLLRVVETGLPQIVFSTTLGPGLTITLQSDGDLAPVPEPSALLLFGTSLAGLGALWRHYRRS